VAQCLTQLRHRVTLYKIIGVFLIFMTFMVCYFLFIYFCTFVARLIWNTEGNIVYIKYLVVIVVIKAEFKLFMLLLYLTIFLTCSKMMKLRGLSGTLKFRVFWNGRCHNVPYCLEKHTERLPNARNNRNTLNTKSYYHRNASDSFGTFRCAGPRHQILRYSLLSSHFIIPAFTFEVDN
jgi:hypothetical protein